MSLSRRSFVRAVPALPLVGFTSGCLSQRPIDDSGTTDESSYTFARQVGSMVDPEQLPAADFDQTERTVAVRGVIIIGSSSNNECRLTEYEHDPPERRLTVSVAKVSKRPYLPEFLEDGTADWNRCEYTLSAQFSGDLPETVLVKEKHAGRDEVVETALART